MFLICTADEKFWNKKEKILFLGEWCKSFKKKSSWEKLDYIVLNYHRFDKNISNKEFNFLHQIYTKNISILSSSLNNIHNKDWSKNCWEILIGHWLSSFSEVFFDRFKSIILANNSFKH